MPWREFVKIEKVAPHHKKPTMVLLPVAGLIAGVITALIMILPMMYGVCAA